MASTTFSDLVGQLKMIDNYLQRYRQEFRWNEAHLKLWEIHVIGYREGKKMQVIWEKGKYYRYVYDGKKHGMFRTFELMMEDWTGNYMV